MHILADANIPLAREAFGPLGDVEVFEGRAPSPDFLARADVLLVRSVTQVDAELLAGTGVRFVGSATAGVDHVDQEFLVKAEITFASAAGCNAESVAQYVAAVLFHSRAQTGLDLAGRTIGIVGAGHCGSRVERIARALGMAPVLTDPALARETGDAKYRPLGEIVDCDFITLHVPLTSEGPDPTRELIGEPFIRAMMPDTILINAARGGVADEAALCRELDARRFAGAAIDAWHGEPSIDVELLDRVDIATPHIAGYSSDAKVRGTQMIHAALCKFMNREPQFDPAEFSEEPRFDALALEQGESIEDTLARWIKLAYSLDRDDAALRESAALPASERPARFDALRRNYPRRREFRAYQVADCSLDPDLLVAAQGLGFGMPPAPPGA